MKVMEKLKILDLSLKEEKVLLSVIDGLNTPLLIGIKTDVSRPAVYEILKKLKKRGLVTTNIVKGKKYWNLARKEDIDSNLYEAKKVLLSISDGTEEVKGLSDGMVIVYRGKDSIIKIISSIAKDHKNERLFTFQGEAVQKGWDMFIGKEKINEFNDDVKKNGILTETIIPHNWFDNHIETLGDNEGYSWAKGFIDRALATYQIDKNYFNHAGQIFIFKNSLYLIAMNEGIIIEIRNSELQKMIKQMFSYIEKNAEKIDVNRRLQTIVENFEKK